MAKQIRKWKCKACGSITEKIVDPENAWQSCKPDVCRKCKEEKTDLWLSTFTEVE